MSWNRTAGCSLRYVLGAGEPAVTRAFNLAEFFRLCKFFGLHRQSLDADGQGREDFVEIVTACDHGLFRMAKDLAN